jgi:hypothetical protein
MYIRFPCILQPDKMSDGLIALMLPTQTAEATNFDLLNTFNE